MNIQDYAAFCRFEKELGSGYTEQQKQDLFRRFKLMQQKPEPAPQQVEQQAAFTFAFPEDAEETPKETSSEDMLLTMTYKSIYRDGITTVTKRGNMFVVKASVVFTQRTSITISCWPTLKSAKKAAKQTKRLVLAVLESCLATAENKEEVAFLEKYISNIKRRVNRVSDYPTYMSKKAAISFLGTSSQNFHKCIEEGKLVEYQKDNKLLYYKPELLQFLQSRQKKLLNKK